MIALDTNILVYAQQRTSPHHRTALGILDRLASATEPWAVPWPCVYEFLRVVTHPRIFNPPLASNAAMRELGRLFAAPGLHLLAETPRHAEFLATVVEQSGATGNLMHDAHIWTLCLEHGVSEFWSADRDFSRFRGLRLHNPFSRH